MLAIRKRLTRALRSIRPKPVILMYHRVAEPEIDPWGLAVSPSHFDEQMALLRASRSVMPLPELVDRYRRRALPSDAVAITFDDGYADNLVEAKPILSRHGLTATLFLATGTVGSRTEYWWDELARLILLNSEGIDITVPVGADTMAVRIPPGGDTDAANWRTCTGPNTPRRAAYLEVWGKLRLRPISEIRATMTLLRTKVSSRPLSEQDLPMSSAQLTELLADGAIGLGGHTVNHPALPSLSVDEQRREIADGKAACEEMSDGGVAGFAYPYGDFDERSAQLARECGFEWACSAEAKGLRNPENNFLWLPRVQVMDWSGEDFSRELREVL
ncbi:polysaccharide deacetylase family protein [Bradyrhizobium jicamae]|uniref:Chitooligosaccharide deacetylase n=1 Tax=Bradyrhizobium jicamae TaxID=280332 RepID=A0ABS5FK19_9BRAD|nr:polysaccharide deacetylase family protein [Bradyrhizobium jicamae]MBR0797136.1 polysaccharide deacetylase family protein [Bradyrhizobium jicamae]